MSPHMFNCYMHVYQCFAPAHMLHDWAARPEPLLPSPRTRLRVAHFVGPGAGYTYAYIIPTLGHHPIPNASLERARHSRAHPPVPACAAGARHDSQADALQSADSRVGRGPVATPATMGNGSGATRAVPACNAKTYLICGPRSRRRTKTRTCCAVRPAAQLRALPRAPDLGLSLVGAPFRPQDLEARPQSNAARSPAESRRTPCLTPPWRCTLGPEDDRAASSGTGYRRSAAHALVDCGTTIDMRPLQASSPIPCLSPGSPDVGDRFVLRRPGIGLWPPVRARPRLRPERFRTHHRSGRLAGDARAGLSRLCRAAGPGGRLGRGRSGLLVRPCRPR